MTLARRHVFLHAMMIVAFTLGLAGLHAKPLELDLGQGLRYFRLRDIPADIPPKEDGRPAPCVIDVRYTESTSDGAKAFMAWLKLRASTRSPVFVLANARTASALLKAFEGTAPRAGVLLVGVPSSRFQPDIPVEISAEDERRAYDALDKDVPIMSLLRDNPDKVRNDEASLSRDRLADASAESAAKAAAPKQPAPPVDAALQRAVHLHRSLVALRRL